MNEIWKDINGFSGYQVSNLGNVKSNERFETTNGCVKERFIKEIILQPATDRGYKIVSLSKGKRQYMKKVHRLVAQAFIPNPDNKRTVNHKDCNPSNNLLDNLEWATDLENTRHARKNNRMSDEKEVVMIKDGIIIKIFKSISQANRETGIQISNISYCCSGIRKTAGGYNWKFKKGEYKNERF